MCELISYKKVDKDIFYLTKDDLKGKKFKEYKKYNPRWRDDIMGHGAIEYFYPEIKGENKECTDFSRPSNFPDCIVEDIKKGNFEGIGICLDILNKEGRKKYDKIEKTAWDVYSITRQSAWDKYNKTRQSAWDVYSKKPQYGWYEYSKIDQSAWDEYNKTRQTEFWKIAKQKKYRNKYWK